MRRSIEALRSIGAPALSTLLVWGLLISVPTAHAGQPIYRPDDWIKLCGINVGCRIDPPPHPWRGKDIYNTTGRRQTAREALNEGQGVRFWIAVQNDGTARDAIRVQGCSGTRVFKVNRVILGKHRRQDPTADDLKGRYIRGTLVFRLEPGEKVFFTLNILSRWEKGREYRCRTELTSLNDPTKQDVVVAHMTTY